jgi:hypothetical protein
MAEESVIGATWAEAKLHPYLIGGAVAVLAVLIWYMSRPSPAATPQNFSFSYGPSDAQVRAGTALQIAQQADTTSLAMANIQAGVQSQTAQDYFSYLTTNSANQLDAAQSGDNAQIAINAQNNGAALQKGINDNLTTVLTSQQQLAYATTVNNNLLATQLGYRPNG